MTAKEIAKSLADMIADHWPDPDNEVVDVGPVEGDDAPSFDIELDDGSWAHVSVTK